MPVRLQANSGFLAGLCQIFAASGLFAAPAFATTTGHYDVTISTAVTQNMSFSNGIYSATGDSAVLNVSDLENALAAGNTEVTTGNGTAGDEKGNLHIGAALTWASASKLTLDAYHTIFVARTISDTGSGALTLKTNDGSRGGVLGFGQGSGITIWSLSDKLTIDGKVYKLAADIHSLASDIVASPAGYYALANNYDASKDGTYTSAPIPEFGGIFNGLGNTISNLQIYDKKQYDNAGFFALLSGAKVSDIILSNVSVSTIKGGDVGGLVADSENSLMSHVRVTGTVRLSSKSSSSPTGGVAAVCENGIIDSSSAAVNIRAGGQSIGGLVGYNSCNITASFSAGTTNGNGGGGGVYPIVGGLIGLNGGTVENSYSTGKVVGSYKASIGGMIGYNSGGLVKESYSIGVVSGLGAETLGGLIGYDGSNSGAVSNSYWDTTTSGVTNPSQGAGYPANDPGITGLTTQQFQSGLPAGFDPTIWAEDPKVNKGFPFVLHNPPPK